MEVWNQVLKLMNSIFSPSGYRIPSQEFLKSLKDIRIDEDEIMVSFDVATLFTSIDIPLAKETLATLLKERDPSDTISTDNMLKLLDLCLMTHFTFNGQIYEQINGTPMRSPISGLIAEAAMQRLKNMALPQIQPKLWIRYTDDTFVITKGTKREETHQLINKTLTGIKFTREGETNEQLPFLDVRVECRATGKFLTK
eukprot:g29105.t1